MRPPWRRPVDAAFGRPTPHSPPHPFPFGQSRSVSDARLPAALASSPFLPLPRPCLLTFFIAPW